LEIIRPRTVPSIVDWAPEHLIIPSKESPKLAGFFDWQYSPHLREPCNWFNDPFVRRITIMAGLQRGKTLFMMLCLCWVIANTPGPTMLVMTDENTLRRRMKRIRPLFAANDYLLAKLGGKSENLFLGEPTDLGDMMLVLAWAGSAAMMSDYPIQYEFLDELVLWNQMMHDLDLDPLGLLRGRQNTFAEDSKTVTVSSSGNVGDLLDTEYEDGDKCEYWIPCPRCGVWQIPIWHDKEQEGCHMMLDKDKAGDWLRLRDYEEGRHARYICPSCMHPWTDYGRAEVMQEGRWLPAGITMDRHGTPSAESQPTAYKSARIRAVMIHPRIGSLGKMAADWVRAMTKKKAGDVSGLKYFLNNHEAQSWKETQAETDESRLRTHMGEYRSEDIRLGKPVPWGVQAITISIDVHDNWFRVVTEGWGHLYEHWLLEATRIETSDTREADAYEPLKALLVKPWPAADRQWLLPSAVTIDTGYRPEPVKNFCRDNRQLVYRGNLLPIRGSPREMRRLYSKIPQDEVLMLYELNTKEYKDRLWRMLFETQQPGQGYMHLPADLSGDVVGELCSEHKLTVAGKPVWVPKKDGRDNHTWDCCGYGLFAADLIGVGLMKPLGLPPAAGTEKATPAPPEPAPQAPTRKIRTRYD
jgi:phage terminase large subunit GpA-like protein